MWLMTDTFTFPFPQIAFGTCASNDAVYLCFMCGGCSAVWRVFLSHAQVSTRTRCDPALLGVPHPAAASPYRHVSHNPLPQVLTGTSSRAG